ncbi:MAG: hypothetical protein FVQ82_11075 [Planctomycetes bacterium]|nr:hypothetical protein [Planctomycetota bacterium]
MKRNPIFIIIGIFIFIGIIIATIYLDGGALMFFHIPSMIFVVVVGGSLGLASYRGGGFIKYITACKKHFMSAGILGTVIGVIQMLQGLSSPDSIGAEVAVGLLAVFYGIILYCIADAISA